MVTRILVVDDDPQILRTLRINLRARHYDIAVAHDGAHALREATDYHPDLVILDLGLPDIDGVQVIHGLRGWTPIPIVVLSGRTGSQDKVEALDAGADDYLTKPFSIDELLARIRAVTRRVTADTTEPAPQHRIGRHLIDLTNKTIRTVDPDNEHPDGDVHLTRTEWQLLEMLLHHPGKLITQRQLLTEIWGPTYTTQTHYLRQYMAQLRRKLEPNPAQPRHLITELGMGYRYQP